MSPNTAVPAGREAFAESVAGALVMYDRLTKED